MSKTTRTVDAPGATITYDVHGDLGDGGAVPLFLLGSPMDALGFTSLASHLDDRPVITYDPRGTARSTRSDGDGPLTPDVHAGDLRLVVDALGVDAIDVFATSGGAINALEWVATGDERVRTLVAHEPPLGRLLADAAALEAAIRDMHETYQQGGIGPGMAKFIFLVSHEGELATDFTFPPLDPASFGLPAEDDGSRGDPLLGQNLLGSTLHQLDLDRVRAASTRVVPARGEGSGEQMAARGASAVAAGLDLDVTMFPSHHAGFVGDEYGHSQGEPEAFAVRLREVVDA